MIAPIEPEDMRTLPERFMDTKECRAYINAVEMKMANGSVIGFKRIRWTCGFTADVMAGVALGVAKPVLKERHAMWHVSNPVKEEVPPPVPPMAG
jgi:hypothetical protein